MNVTMQDVLGSASSLGEADHEWLHLLVGEIRRVRARGLRVEAVGWRRVGVVVVHLS